MSETEERLRRSAPGVSPGAKPDRLLPHPSPQKPGSSRLLPLLTAFILGAALGGIAAWQAAIHGGWKSSNLSGASETTAASQRSGETRSRPSGKAQRFVPSADSSSDLHRILRMRDATERTSAFHQLLSTMKPDAVANLMKALGRYGDDQEQEDQIGGLMALMAARQLVIDHVSQSDPEAVLTALSAAAPDAKKGENYSDVLRAWAARDPAAARSFFEQSTLGDKGIDARSVAGSLVRELVKDDPEGTFLWLRGLKADFVEPVARDALQTLSHYDGVKAGKLLEMNKDLLKASDCVAAMTEGWARTEPEKALQWAVNLPADISTEGIKTAAGAWSGKDFPAAIQSVETLKDGARAAALNGIAAVAGEKHLKELLPLVTALPESGDRAAAVGSLVGSWVERSPDEASAWLSTHPEGASRDQGAIVLAVKTVNTEPKSALEWAASIGAKDQRQKGVDGLIEVWLKNDPASARAWVQETPRLSPEERARLLERTGR